MSTAVPALEIRLLGEPEVLVAGRPCALPASKKTRALLGYLVATARPQRRERLCELFWDGPDDPRAGLRWSLSKLRPLLDVGDAARLVADREHAGFDAHGAVVDVALLRALDRARLTALDPQALEGFAALFRGRFLEGLELASCPAFHAWCIAEREMLGQLHVSLLGRLIESTRAEPARALVHARTLVALDPLAESPRLVVMDLLALLGERRRVIEEYENYASLLRRELGTDPSFEVERRRMAQRRPAASGSTASGAATSVAAPIAEAAATRP
ncbi:MAG TPA: BTAD domain-containing putative transcriptional regulator, partial [Polyangiaceae bacterium]|nr:BTAD domain-containing putative transcriptional regulator [Polyangiaceae bacterium]